MRAWCEENSYTYYASEYNIGSSGGYNWIFKAAYGMGLKTALLMQADVRINNPYPLIITNNLTEYFGDRDFFIWPQQTYKYWENAEGQQTEPWLKQRLHNLGNLVGFNPQVQWEKDCYFDENYVVTHYDDVEFLLHLDNTGKMGYKNVADILNLTTQYYSDEEIPGIMSMPHSYNVKNADMHLTVCHASMKIDKLTKGIENSHGPWYDFNKPYYERVERRKWVRLPYDPQRWQQHGYPAYPVLHELQRFFEQQPQLLTVDSKLWEIPNKTV